MGSQLEDQSIPPLIPVCKKSHSNTQTKDETLNPARTSETPQISDFQDVSRIEKNLLQVLNR